MRLEMSEVRGTMGRRKTTDEGTSLLLLFPTILCTLIYIIREMSGYKTGCGRNLQNLRIFEIQMKMCYK